VPGSCFPAPRLHANLCHRIVRRKKAAKRQTCITSVSRITLTGKCSSNPLSTVLRPGNPNPKIHFTKQRKNPPVRNIYLLLDEAYAKVLRFSSLLLCIWLRNLWRNIFLVRCLFASRTCLSTRKKKACLLMK